MNSHPLLFTGENIRAIYKNRKTMTRRVIKPQPSATITDWTFAAESGDRVMYRGWPHVLRESRGRDKRAAGDLTPVRVACPYGVPGDLLWVRETWGAWPHMGGGVQLDSVRYHSTDKPPDDPHNAWRWRASIHMPRSLSRLILRVSNVRVERVQDISEEDVQAEGVYMTTIPKAPPLHVEVRWVAPGVVMTNAFGEQDNQAPAHSTAVKAFQCLWDSINAKRGYSWDSNPWCWCVTWDRAIQANVDEVLADPKRFGL